MVVRLARLLAQLIGLLLLILLAVAGIAAAVFCIDGGHGGISLASLAKDLHLPELRQRVGHFLATVQDPGAMAVVAIVAGAGAILAALVLLLGLFGSPRERLIRLGDDGDGELLARRRALANAVGTLAARAEGVGDLHVRVRPNRRRLGGRVRLRARVSASGGDSGVPAIRAQITTALAPLVDSLPLRARVKVKKPKRRSGQAAEPVRRRVL